MDIEPFKTSDTGLAGYLHTKGMEILGTVKNDKDERRKDFVFVDSPEREQWVEEYYSGTGTVPARQYHHKSQYVRRFLRVTIDDNTINDSQE